MAAKTTARKNICTVCKKRPVIGGVRGDISGDYCYPCYDYAGHENSHCDEGHDDEDYEMPADTDCLVCLDQDPANEDVKVEEPKKKGHSNGIAKSNTSHAGCMHEATKSARAKCRKERAAEAAK